MGDVRPVNRRRSRDERGVGIVTVLMIAFVVFALGGAWVQYGVHQVQASSSDRFREQARHAAEAGANAAMSALSANRDYTGTGLTTVNLNDSTGQYEVRVFSDPFADPNMRYIEAVGYAPSKTAPRRAARRIEQQVRLIPVDGFQYGLFSLTSGIITNNNMNVVGDVYSATDLSLSSYATIAGNVYSLGSVTTRNQSTISGDVHAANNATIDDSKTTVSGNVFAGGNVSITGRVKGNVQAGGTITGGTVDGFRSPGSPPVPPPVQTLPTFTWNAANYSPAYEWTNATTLKSFWSTNRTAFAGGHHLANCTGPCASVAFDQSWTMSGNTTIVSDGQITLSRDIANSTGAPVNLVVVSNYSSTTSAAISVTNNLTLPADIRVLLFAPNACIEFKNLKNFTGVVYAKCITVDQNFSLTYFPMSTPGFTWSLAAASHYKVEVVSFREVPYQPL